MKNAKVLDPKFLKRLRTLSLIEGVSTLLLFGVAMPLKYMADMPIAVTIVGSVHGVLFLLLVTMFLLAIKIVPLRAFLACVGIFAAVIPFGPFVFDRYLRD